MNVYDDTEAVAGAAADLVEGLLNEGASTLVLAGGATPRRCYELLADRRIEWGRVTVLFGDERCVPPDDSESNYRAAREALLSRVAPASVHRIPGELGAEAAAAEYEAVVSRFDALDVVLLGIGPDGHTASLFPGNAALRSARLVEAVHNAPKPPPDRVTLTLNALRKAKHVAFLVTGEDKADAVAAAVDAKVPSGMIPGATWLVDRAAAARVPAASA